MHYCKIFLYLSLISPDKKYTNELKEELKCDHRIHKLEVCIKLE